MARSKKGGALTGYYPVRSGKRMKEPHRNSKTRVGGIAGMAKGGEQLRKAEDKDQLGLFSGEQLKDEGVERVLKNAKSWGETIRFVIETVAASHPQGFTNDDVRVLARNWEIPDPHHPNAWGAAFNAAAKAGLIEKTQTFRKSEEPSRHAAEVRVWVRKS